MRATWRRHVVVGAGGIALAFACGSPNRYFQDSTAEAGAAGSPDPGNHDPIQAGETSDGGPIAENGGETTAGKAGGGEGGAETTSPCGNAQTCDLPPGEKCENDARVVYAATGTCEGGECTYASTRTPCDGGTPRCRDAGATTTCVACLSDGDCKGNSPVCNTTAGTCGPRPSCKGLAATCGPSGNGDCCASGVVTGGTFFRGYDNATHTDKSNPATISDYRLDDYEITVGRFRKFVADYSQTMLKSGAGANPNNAADTGWNTNWNGALPVNAAALSAALKCDADYQTWTDSVGANESRPLNCISWYEAAVFCAWDGGRLPTEAEWNYAAAGGTEQRVYPWGATALGANASLSVYGCYFNGSSTCTFLDIAPVGSVSAGNGKYGQSDLAGNVAEWLQDWDGSYPNPCTDCANLAAAEFRVIRGGAFLDNQVSYQQAATRFDYSEPEGRFATYGARCARNATP